MAQRQTLIVRRRASRAVSNHEAGGPSFETTAKKARVLKMTEILRETDSISSRLLKNLVLERFS